MAETIEVMVDGGSASAGPPLGPALGPLGLPITQVIKDINNLTKAFKGMKVPVKLVVDPGTKKYEITVGVPPVSSLILKELGEKKGSGAARTEFIGNLTIEQITKIAEMKRTALLGKGPVERVKEILGTCVSMGVKVEDKPAKTIERLISDGEFREKIENIEH